MQWHVGQHPVAERRRLGTADLGRGLRSEGARCSRASRPTASCCNSPTRKILEWTLQAVRDAAEDEGRDPDAITVCVVAPAYVGEESGAPARPVALVRRHGRQPHPRLGDALRRRRLRVPRVLAEYIRQRQGYDYSHHGRSGNPDTEFVPDGSSSTGCASSAPRRPTSRSCGSSSLWAFDHFAVYLMHDDKEGTLAAYGEQVIPAVTSAV